MSDTERYCNRCQHYIRRSYYKVRVNVYFHIGCFTCNSKGCIERKKKRGKPTNLGIDGYFLHNTAYVCQRCIIDDHIATCGTCQRQLSEGAFMQLESSAIHFKCRRCSFCQLRIGSFSGNIEGALACATCCRNHGAIVPASIESPLQDNDIGVLRAERIDVTFVQQFRANFCTIQMAMIAEDDNPIRRFFSIAENSKLYPQFLFRYLAPRMPNPDVLELQLCGLVYTQTPSRFIAQLDADSRTADRISHNLSMLYETDQQRARFTMGDEFLHPGVPVAARYTQDGDLRWYRAIIVEIDNTPNKENPIQIRFVDYGNYQQVTRNQIKLMPIDMGCDPPLAIKCRLKGTEEDEEFDRPLISNFLGWINHVSDQAGGRWQIGI